MTTPARSLSPALNPSTARDVIERVARALGSVVLGKDAEIALTLTCMVARGHLLIEDVPGVGKTTLAEAISRAFGLSWARVQFTSDLMPADILGGQIFKPQTGTFELRRGPLFHQLVLADELNRAPPRTQSALLEAMSQRQVSLDGVTHPLPAPFVGGRHPEPGGPGRHLSPPRFAARPVPTAAVAGPPLRGAGGDAAGSSAACPSRCASSRWRPRRRSWSRCSPWRPGSRWATRWPGTW